MRLSPSEESALADLKPLAELAVPFTKAVNQLEAGRIFTKVAQQVDSSAFEAVRTEERKLAIAVAENVGIALPDTANQSLAEITADLQRDPQFVIWRERFQLAKTAASKVAVLENLGR